MHILIVGEIGVGKSSLIQKLTRGIKKPLYGFITKKHITDHSGNAQVYIHKLSGPPQYGEDNCIGKCTPQGGIGCKAAFDRAVQLLTSIPKGSLVMMDELGVLEGCSPMFCKAVMDLLNGPYTVIAAVKTASTPFLNDIRCHPEARIYVISEENRDKLYDVIKDHLAGAPYFKELDYAGLEVPKQPSGQKLQAARKS